MNSDISCRAAIYIVFSTPLPCLLWVWAVHIMLLATVQKKTYSYIPVLTPVTHTYTTVHLNVHVVVQCVVLVPLLMCLCVF